MNDPIIGTVKIVLNRLLLFIVMSACAGLAVWLVLMEFLFIVPNVVDQWAIVEAGYLFPTIYPYAAAVLYGSLVVGILLTSIIFLLAAVYWGKRGNVYHQRGARVVNGPGEGR